MPIGRGVPSGARRPPEDEDIYKVELRYKARRCKRGQGPGKCTAGGLPHGDVERAPCSHLVDSTHTRLVWLSSRCFDPAHRGGAGASVDRALTV